MRSKAGRVAGVLRYPISATAVEKPLPRKGQESFPSWTSPVRPRSPALEKAPISHGLPRRSGRSPIGKPASGLVIQWSSIVQPPGIGISPIADMDAHQTIVTAALAAKSSAETPKNASWEARAEAMRREISSPAVAPRQPRLRSALVVLVVAAPPRARLAAPLRGAVE